MLRVNIIKQNHCINISFLLVLTSLSSLLVLPLLSYRLGVSDFVIGILASLSFLSASVGTAFSRTGTHYIIASCVGLLGPQVSTVIRSQLSKAVAERELGKVYTLLGCLEAAVPLAASPLLTEIYNNSLQTFPGQTSPHFSRQTSFHP